MPDTPDTFTVDCLSMIGGDVRVIVITNDSNGPRDQALLHELAGQDAKVARWSGDRVALARLNDDGFDVYESMSDYAATLGLSISDAQ